MIGIIHANFWTRWRTLKSGHALNVFVMKSKNDSFSYWFKVWTAVEEILYGAWLLILFVLKNKNAF